MKINIYYADKQFKTMAVLNDTTLEECITQFYADNPELLQNKSLEHDLKMVSVYSQNTKLEWHHTIAHYGLSEDDNIHLFSIPDLNLKDITKLQGLSRGFLTRKKYELQQMPQESLTHYPIFVKGNDPDVKTVQKQHAQGEKIAVVATAGFKVIEIVCSLVKKQEIVNEQGEINQEKVPRIIIVDNSKKVFEFWTNFQRFMNDDSKTINRNFFNKNYKNFLIVNSPLWNLHEMGDRRKPGTALEELTSHFTQLIWQYDYDYLRALIRKAWIIPQTWEDTSTFEKIKNLADFHGISAIYAYPSNLIGLKKEETQHQILHNITLLNPVLSIHSSFCQKHDRPERFLFFTPQDNLRTLFFNHCITKISADDINQCILAKNFSALDVYHYLTDAKQTLDYRYDINCADYNGNSALITAAKVADITLVRAFCKMGAYVNHRNKKYQSALTFALEDNNLDLVKMLIESGYKLGHPFDQASIEKSSPEIVAYLQMKLEETRQNELLISDNIQKYLEKNPMLLEALTQIKSSKNFPNDCNQALDLLHQKIKEPIQRNNVEILKWFLDTNFIQIAKITQHDFGSDHKNFEQLTKRKEKIFELLINHGDSLWGINPWMNLNSNMPTRIKPEPLAICLSRFNAKVAYFLTELQRTRYKNLEIAFEIETCELESMRRYN